VSVHDKATECCTGCTAVPAREIASGEFVALLVTVTVPVTFPVAAGAKVTFSVAVCPAVRMVPVGTPLALNPAPEMLRLEMVMFAAPELVKVTGRMLLLPTVTLLKFKLIALLASAPGVAGALSLLLLLPAESAAGAFAPVAPTQPVCASSKANPRSETTATNRLEEIKSLGVCPCWRAWHLRWRFAIVSFITRTAYWQYVMSHYCPKEQEENSWSRNDGLQMRFVEGKHQNAFPADIPSLLPCRSRNVLFHSGTSKAIRTGALLISDAAQLSVPLALRRTGATCSNRTC
jgi:hypothetical protein